MVLPPVESVSLLCLLGDSPQISSNPLHPDSYFADYSPLNEPAEILPFYPTGSHQWGFGRVVGTFIPLSELWHKSAHRAFGVKCHFMRVLTGLCVVGAQVAH